MRSRTASPHLNWDLPNALSHPAAQSTDDPAIRAAHLIADAVMSIAGPLFWAVLALGLLAAVLGIRMLSLFYDCCVRAGSNFYADIASSATSPSRWTSGITGLAE
jgi:hypothetical protein